MTEPLPFDIDLQKIVEDRAYAKLREFRENLEVFGCGKKSPIPWEDPDFWESYFVHICEREIFVKLPDEVKRYNQKYPRLNYETDIEKARKGDDESLYRIIEFA